MLSPSRKHIFPRQALLACDDCSAVFINWTRTETTCRECHGTQLHEIRWHQQKPDRSL